jgi:hypothetical protein
MGQRERAVLPGGAIPAGSRAAVRPATLALASAVGNRAVARAAAGVSVPRGRGLTQSSALTLAMRRTAPRALLQRDDLVGPGKAVDPGDNACSLQWTPDKGWKWLKPSGISCDPGMFGLKGSGDPFTYPYDYGDKPSTTIPGIDRPSDCPADRWEPPSQKNLFIGHCRPPAAAPASPDIPLPPPTPSQPGDYNVPDPDADRYA